MVLVASSQSRFTSILIESAPSSRWSGVEYETIPADLSGSASCSSLLSNRLSLKRAANFTAIFFTLLPLGRKEENFVWSSLRCRLIRSWRSIFCHRPPYCVRQTPAPIFLDYLCDTFLLDTALLLASVRLYFHAFLRQRHVDYVSC